MTDTAGRSGERVLRIDLQYDGTGFVGWQSQARGRTVQDELERALLRLLQEDVRPVGSGRTDAGTHALGQVAHVHTASTMDGGRLLRGLNALLPPDVAATRVLDVAGDFHARFSALGKRYRYRLSRARRPLSRHRIWVLERRLDLAPMADAAATLVGSHDFQAFCKALPAPDHFTCRIDHASWRQDGGELVFEIEANRFLRHMVRILVGTLVDVGLGKLSPAAFAELLDGQPRSAGGVTAPARGLCLLRVFYEEAAGGPSGEEDA